MKMFRAGWFGVVAVAALVGAVGLASAPSDLPEMDGVPTAEPEVVGMSSERLERLDTVMQGYVDRNESGGGRDSGRSSGEGGTFLGRRSA